MIERPIEKQHAHTRRNDGKQQRLYEDLRYDSPSARTERRANRKLPKARRGAREHQHCDVAARDEQ